MSNPDIAIALERFRKGCGQYEKADRYYRGEHDLKFATEKFKNVFGPMFREFALNLCPAVVDALRDKLIITEFGVEEGGGEQLANDAWKIWQANRMPKRSGEVHKEAVKSGDAYAIVWPNAAGQVTIYPNRASTCTVVYDEETPGKILWAAKHWKTNDKRFRLNLYYPDRIEKYISKKKKAEDLPVVRPPQGAQDKYNNFYRGMTSAAYQSQLPEAKEFVPFSDAEGGEVVKNPYGTVPVFHFANNSDIGMPGQSELLNAIPVQDALNKSVLDMLVAMEFASYRQRWASGIEIEYDEESGKPIPPFTAGIEKLWTTENENAKFGDFEAADLEQFLKVKDGFRIDMACVTGTPIWYFMQAKAEFPSGEALRKSETRFTNKVRDRQQSFGQVWEDVIAFALTIENKGKNLRLFAEWEDPSPLSEKEELENILIKKDAGISDEQALMEMGYGKEDITRMIAENKAKRDAMVDSFNAGEEGDDEL